MNATDTTTKTTTAPNVGEGMTLSYPQDSYPYVIVRVSDSGKRAWVKPVKIVDLNTGHKPDHFLGPFPVWHHRYTEEELASMVMDGAPEREVRLSKHGYWTSRGATFHTGGAYYHRNFSD